MAYYLLLGLLATTLAMKRLAPTHPSRVAPVRHFPPAVENRLHEFAPLTHLNLQYVDERPMHMRTHKHGFSQPLPDHVTLQFKAFDG